MENEPKPCAKCGGKKGQWMDKSINMAEDSVWVPCPACKPAPTPEGSAEIGAYDAGLLNDYGGGNVAWWQDYIRAELERSHDHYIAEVRRLRAELAKFRSFNNYEKTAHDLEKAEAALAQAKKQLIDRMANAWPTMQELINKKDADITQSRADLEAMTAECQEQARLNGMGGEREAKLISSLEVVRAVSALWKGIAEKHLSELESVRGELSQWEARANEYSADLVAVRKDLEAMKSDRDKIAADFGTYMAAVEKKEPGGPYSEAINQRRRAESLDADLARITKELVEEQRVKKQMSECLDARDAALAALQAVMGKKDLAIREAIAGCGCEHDGTPGFCAVCEGLQAALSLTAAPASLRAATVLGEMDLAVLETAEREDKFRDDHIAGDLARIIRRLIGEKGV